MKLTRCLFVVIALMVLAGCAQPQAGEPMRVYGSAKTVVPVGYSPVTSTQVYVLPNKVNIPLEGRYPYQNWNTEIYGNCDNYVIVQKMILNTQFYSFKELKGATAEMWGTGWRKGNYTLSANTADKEYFSYFETIRKEGGDVAPLYDVAIYDKRVTPKVVARVISLTPTNGRGNAAMPSFNDLYEYNEWGNWGGKGSADNGF